MSMNISSLQSLRRPRVSQLVTAAEIALVAVLGIQAARLVWTFAEPAGPVGAEPKHGGAARIGDLSILSRFDPFFRAGEAAPAPGAEAPNQGLRLFGVRVAGDGAGSAIIRTTDGREASFATGE